MEQDLEMLIMEGADDEDIEYVILNNILIDRDNVQEIHKFDLDQMSNEDIVLNFRFERNDILRLQHYLGIQDEVITATRNKVNGLTALCILLKRLSYPNRLKDLCSMFGLSSQSISQILICTTNLIIEHCGNLLNNLNNLQWLNQERLQYYAQAVRNKGGAVRNCWGFIDGTARQICRPMQNQEEYYSGHKRHHCIKFQSVICPDGVIASLKGAYIGRRHDAAIFRESEIYRELEQIAVINEHEKFTVYGDQGYGLMELVLTPFHGRNHQLLPHQLEFNASMKVLRIAVEWGFQKVVTLFAYVDFWKSQKLQLQQVDSLYKIAVLLTNCHTCLYGSQTATYFNTVPPTLDEYFGQ